jgi:crotonobetainyl-CoA:carnitine CoA-transferase CaiB-like acyl-CoA transferase
MIKKYGLRKEMTIKKQIGDWVVNQSTQEILNILEPADIWCAEVLDWENMLKHEGFKIIRHDTKN